VSDQGTLLGRVDFYADADAATEALDRRTSFNLVEDYIGRWVRALEIEDAWARARVLRRAG
jgi:hypothetical protein